MKKAGIEGGMVYPPNRRENYSRRQALRESNKPALPLQGMPPSSLNMQDPILLHFRRLG
jgi:hypothetical protein